MITKFRFAAALLTVVGLTAGAIAIAEPGKDAKPAGEFEFKLPAGWTQADLEKCMLAGTPGKQQERLAADKGEWTGKTTTWMGPEGEPMSGECTCTVTPILDGRFTLVEVKGEMPKGVPYHGQGYHGFDNVSQKFVCSWVDNHSTGMAIGEGALSKDGKELTWQLTFNCPLTGKPAKMRQIETKTGENGKTLVMYGPEPKSGKEYKMLSIELTRK